MATLAECRSGFRHCKSEQLALGLPPQAGLNVKQPLLRYSWAQSQDLHYSSGSFMCATCPPCSLHCPHTHHLSLTLFSWLYSTSSHLWSRATLSPVYLHYPHLKIYCSELLPVLYKWLRRCLLFGAEWSQRFLSKLIFSSISDGPELAGRKRTHSNREDDDDDEDDDGHWGTGRKKAKHHSSEPKPLDTGLSLAEDEELVLHLLGGQS
ncbi:probable ATP-dependent RNA helicase DDX10 isoform X1 [Tachysurus ichikawai]